MPLATYGGSPIFGFAPLMRTVDRPSRAYLQQAFGAEGLILLPGGGEGRWTFASGLVIAASPLALGQLRSEVEALKDGQCRVLVDCLGKSWPSVQLEAWYLNGRWRQDWQGRAFSRFAARLLHLA